MRIWAVYSNNAMDIVYASADKKKAEQWLIEEWNNHYGSGETDIDLITSYEYYEFYGPIYVD